MPFLINWTTGLFFVCLEKSEACHHFLHHYLFIFNIFDTMQANLYYQCLHLFHQAFRCF